jgi:hypothetical protein
MQHDHYTKYVEKFYITAEPTETLNVNTFLPTITPVRLVEHNYTEDADIISIIVAISVATSAITTIFIFCGGIYCGYLRNKLKHQYLGDISSLDSSSQGFEIDDIYIDSPIDDENPQFIWH